MAEEYEKIRMYMVMIVSYAFDFVSNGDKGAGYGSGGYGTSACIGTLRGILRNLGYIKSLGYNTLWITPPFNSYRGEPDANGMVNIRLDATGYYTRNYFAIDPYFGTTEEFRTLVKSVHDQDMKFCLDVALGHNKGNVVPSPQGFTIGNIPNFDLPETIAFFNEFFVYWIENFQIDMFRLDQSYQVPLSAWYQFIATIQKTVAKRKQEGERWGIAGLLVAEVLCFSPIDYQDGLGYCGPLPSSGSTFHSSKTDCLDCKDSNMDQKLLQLEKDISFMFTPDPVTGIVLPCQFNFPMMFVLRELIAFVNIDNDPIPVEREKISTKPLLRVFEWMETISVIRTHQATLCMMFGNHDFARIGNLMIRSGVVKSINDPRYWARFRLFHSFLCQYTGAMHVFYNDESGSYLEGFAAKIIEDCLPRNLCDDHVGRINGQTTLFSPEQASLIDFVTRLNELRHCHLALSHGKQVIVQTDQVFAAIKIFAKSSILFLMNVSELPQTRNLQSSFQSIFGTKCSFLILELLLSSNPHFVSIPKYRTKNLTITVPPLTALFFNILEQAKCFSSLWNLCC
jgi:hypothetical protein